MDPFDEIRVGYYSERFAVSQGRRIFPSLLRAGRNAAGAIERDGRWLYHDLIAVAGALDAWWHLHSQNRNVGRPMPPDPPAPPPGPPSDPQVAIDDYAGMAHPVKGLITPDTFKGRPLRAHLVAHSDRTHREIQQVIDGIVARVPPRRALRPGSPASPRITRAMARAAQRAGELFETPAVKRTAAGVWKHTIVERDRGGRYHVYMHPYRIAAHAVGAGDIAHLIP